MDMYRSSRRLAGCLLLIGGLAACASPAPNQTMPTVTTVPSESPGPSGVFSEAPITSAPTAVAQPLPLTLSRSGGIAGVQDQVKIDTNGTATRTQKSGQATTTKLSATELAALPAACSPTRRWSARPRPPTPPGSSAPTVSSTTCAPPT